MSCFVSDKTKFFVVKKLKNIVEARKYCESSGYRLAFDGKKLQESLKNCTIFLDQFIVDQENNDENPFCFFLYQRKIETNKFEKDRMCDIDIKRNFLCFNHSKLSLTTRQPELISNVERSNLYIFIIFITCIVVIGLIGLLTYCLKKYFQARTNARENIPLRQVASTSATDTVCLYNNSKHLKLSKSKFSEYDLINFVSGSVCKMLL